MNSYPVISWDSLLCADPGPTITHSSDADGYPFENISDWRDYTQWKSSETGELFVKLDASGLSGQSVTVDTMVIAGHNLGSAEVTGLVLKWSDDDVVYTPCFNALDPEDDRVIFRLFTEQTRRYFKLVIPSGYSQAPKIGVLFIAKSLQIPAYPDSGFDPDEQEADLAAQYGRTGRLLGVAERFRRRRIRASFSRLPASFITDEWLTFFSSHGAKPFFFTWDPEGRPEESYLVRLSEPKIEAPYDRAFRSLSLSMSGVAK